MFFGDVGQVVASEPGSFREFAALEVDVVAGIVGSEVVSVKRSVS